MEDRSPATPDPVGSRSAASGLRLPPVQPLDHQSGLAQSLRHALTGFGQPAGTHGHLETLALQIGLATGTPTPELQAPQMLVFAADHGVLDELSLQSHLPDTTARVHRILHGPSALQTLAEQADCALTLVDAGMATPLVEPPNCGAVRLLSRKIGFGTRNMVRGPAMTGEQTLAAIGAGMDLVRHLPGNVVGLGMASAGADLSASLILSRLCTVSLEETLPDAERWISNTERDQMLRLLFELMRKHRPAQKPLALLAAVGGFDLAMAVGAMVQAASEHRVILLDGYLTGAAALVARELRPAVTDHLVFSHRSDEHRHRLMLIHLQAEPLLDLRLHTEDGTAPLLAWPLVRAAASLLSRAPDPMASWV